MRSSLLAILVSLALAGPSLAGRSVDRVVAVVNDDLVLESEVEQNALMSLKANGRDVDFDSTAGRRQWDELKHKALDDLIDEKLVLQQANELKLSVTSEQVDRALDEVKQQNGLTDAQFRDALKAQGFSMDSYRRQLRKQILEMQAKNISVGSRINVTDDEIRQIYDSEVGKIKGEMRYHLQLILVQVSPKASDEDIARKQRVAEKVVELARGGTRWAELVRSYSDDDLSKAEGGDLGYVAKEDLVDAVADEIEQMKNGELRGPIRTGRGFQIVKLVDKKSKDVVSYEAAKEGIRRRLFAQQLERVTQSWLKELRRKAHLDIRF